jgi:hypothetical protein
MLFRWIDQKLVFSTTSLDGTNVVLVHSCVLLCGEKTILQIRFSVSDLLIKIVLGSIPIKCPKMALARSALLHLDSALRLFEEVSQNSRAIKVLVRRDVFLDIPDLILTSL